MPEPGEAEPSMSYNPSDKANYAYEVDVYLPATELWYFYPTKACITRQFTGPYQMFLTDAQVPMFVKGGTILPLLILPARSTGKSAKTGAKSLL